MIESWASIESTDNGGDIDTMSTVQLDAVPAGKLLVVEHVSGRLAVRDGEVVEFLQAAAQGANSVVYLPVHFAGSPSQFSEAQGIGRWHQFGSPARLYVRAGWRLVVSGGADATFGIYASAIGYLVDA
ncbi:hypothetical protein DVS77_16400 [Mycolicibacterium moriokaense]|nr:hypothetical protein DVS77_16400 [Mycolicibacterium moriokaense]